MTQSVYLVRIIEDNAAIAIKPVPTGVGCGKARDNRGLTMRKKAKTTCFRSTKPNGGPDPRRGQVCGFTPAQIFCDLRDLRCLLRDFKNQAAQDQKAVACRLREGIKSSGYVWIGKRSHPKAASMRVIYPIRTGSWLMRCVWAVSIGPLCIAISMAATEKSGKVAVSPSKKSRPSSIAVIA